MQHKKPHLTREGQNRNSPNRTNKEGHLLSEDNHLKPAKPYRDPKETMEYTQIEPCAQPPEQTLSPEMRGKVKEGLNWQRTYP